MAQIHYDYDTDVVPKRFAEAPAEEDVPRKTARRSTQRKGTAAAAVVTTSTEAGASSKGKSTPRVGQKRGRHAPVETDEAVVGQHEDQETRSLSPAQTMNETLSNERLAKLQALKERMRASAAANRKDVIAEHDQKQGSLKPWEEETLLRKRREAERLIAAKEALEKGEDIKRKEAMGYTLEEVEDWEQRQMKKKANLYDGFKSVDHANARKYRKLQESIQPDLQKYQQQKAKHGEAKATALEDMALFETPDKEAVSEMVTDLREQFKRRKQHSRRRAHDPNADVNYINEKNRHFSQKLSRAYDKYTEDIRNAFERGTAL